MIDKTIFDKKTIFSTLMGVLCGIILVTMFLKGNNSRIAIVDFTGLIKEFEQTTVNGEIPIEEVNKRVREFSKNIGSVMNDIASKKKVILLPAEAVIAGDVTDYTQEIEKKLQKMSKLYQAQQKTNSKMINNKKL